MTLKLEEGKAYVMNAPRSGFKTKIHIDAIIEDPLNKGDIFRQLVVYRSWGKYKKRWFRHVEPYWVLAEYNKWEYELD